jgi:hypothetical protein
MLQWLSLNDSPEGISADEWVRMLQSALPATKYEPGPSGGSSFAMTDLNQGVDEESTGMAVPPPTMLTCSGPDLDVKKL